MGGHATKGEVATACDQHVDEGVLFVKTWQGPSWSTGFEVAPNYPQRDGTIDLQTLPDLAGHPRPSGTCLSVVHATGGQTFYGQEIRADLDTHLGVVPVTPAGGVQAAVSGYPTEAYIDQWVYVPEDFDLAKTTKYGTGWACIRNPSTGALGGTAKWPGGSKDHAWGATGRILPSASPSSSEDYFWKLYLYVQSLNGGSGPGNSPHLSTPSGGSQMPVALGEWIFFRWYIRVNATATANGVIRFYTMRPYLSETVPHLAYERTNVQFRPAAGVAQTYPLTGLWLPCNFLGGTQKTPRDGFPSGGDSGARRSYQGDVILDDEPPHIATSSDSFNGGTGDPPDPPPDPPPASEGTIGAETLPGSPSLSANSFGRTRGAGPFAVPTDDELIRLVLFGWRGDGLGPGAGAAQAWRGAVRAGGSAPTTILTFTANGSVADDAAEGDVVAELNYVLDTTLHPTIHLYLSTGSADGVSRYANEPGEGSVGFRVYTADFLGGEVADLAALTPSTQNTNLPQFWVGWVPYTEPEPPIVPGKYEGVRYIGLRTPRVAP